MSCWHYYAPQEPNETAFSMDSSRIVFGRGALVEVGDHVRALGARRVALFTDARLLATEHVAKVRRALQAAGVDFAVYSDVKVEPTDQSFLAAARFAREGRFDGYVSVGGGSVMDTCKAAALYATHPAEFLTYVNKPVGEGAPVPGPLPPHVACPTTCRPTSPVPPPAAPAARPPGSPSATCSRCTRRPASPPPGCARRWRWSIPPARAPCPGRWWRRAASTSSATRSSRTRRVPTRRARSLCRSPPDR